MNLPKVIEHKLLVAKSFSKLKKNKLKLKEKFLNE